MSETPLLGGTELAVPAWVSETPRSGGTLLARASETPLLGGTERAVPVWVSETPRSGGTSLAWVSGTPRSGGTLLARVSGTPRPGDTSLAASATSAATPSRTRRTLLAALLAAAVVLPLSAATQSHIPAPPPATLPTPLTPAGLATAYAANRADVLDAARMAAAHGDTSRAAADRALASPGRRLLHFDARGSGQATEVLGDLAHATRVAVLVPGSDTTLDTYARFHTAADSLYRRLTYEQPHIRTAVIAWLGYRTPATISATVLTPGRAGQAAPVLRGFLRELRTLTARPRPAAVSLLCHSYGTVVCARAAPTLTGLGVTDIALVGSPGTGADSAAALHTSARIWAARGAADWIADVPHLRADLFGTSVGFGTDPVSPAFGARVFAAGPGGHSDYFTPGSASLANLARIVLGETTEVTRG